MKEGERLLSLALDVSQIFARGLFRVWSPSVIQLEAAFHRRKRPMWMRWRIDETYIRVCGHWRYLYRAAAKTGQTIDFLLTEQRDERLEGGLRTLQ
jgi:DDE domain